MILKFLIIVYFVFLTIKILKDIQIYYILSGLRYNTFFSLISLQFVGLTGCHLLPTPSIPLYAFYLFRVYHKKKLLVTKSLLYGKFFLIVVFFALHFFCIFCHDHGINHFRNISIHISI